MDWVGDVVFEDGRDVFLNTWLAIECAQLSRARAWRQSHSLFALSYLWKVALAVADEQARLAAAAVTDDDNLLGVGGRLGEVRRSRLAARSRAHRGTDGAVARSRALVAARLVVVGRGVV